MQSILSEDEYDATLRRISELLDSLSGAKYEVNDIRIKELNSLCDSIEQYEEKHYPIGVPDPISEFEFYKDQSTLTPAEFARFYEDRTNI